MLLSPTTAAPGSVVAVSGRGRRKTNVRILIGGVYSGKTVRTNGGGQYATTITVPTAPDGPLKVTAEQPRLADGVWAQIDNATLTIKNPVVVPPPPVDPPEPEPEPWVFGVHEGGSLNVAAGTRVRYGANGIYVEKTASGQVACTNATFGDPVPTVVKHCDYIGALVVDPPPVEPPIPPSPSPTVPPGLASGAITLQQAVDQATAGSTFGVPPRVFAPIRTDKAIGLVGVAAGVVIDAAGATNGVLATAGSLLLDWIEVRNANPGDQKGGIEAFNLTSLTLRRVNTHHHQGAGIGSHFVPIVLVEDSETHDNRQIGYSIGDTDSFTFKRSKTYSNNQARLVDPGWEAGGGKSGRHKAALIVDSQAYDNWGPGFWSDIDGNGFVVQRARAWGNAHAGIMDEIGESGQILDSVAWGNGWDKPNWGYGAQILVSSSRDVPVEGCLAYMTDDVPAWALTKYLARGGAAIEPTRGIVALSQARGTDPVGKLYNPGMVNVTLRDSTVIAKRAQAIYLAGLFCDWADPLFQGGTNRAFGMRYYHPAAEPTANRFNFATPPPNQYGGGYDRLTVFAAKFGDTTSRYLTGSERDAALAAPPDGGAPVPA